MNYDLETMNKKTKQTSIFIVALFTYKLIQKMGENPELMKCLIKV